MTKRSPADDPIEPQGSSTPVSEKERETLARAGHSLEGLDLSFFERLRPSQRNVIVTRLDAIVGSDAGLTAEQASQMVAVGKSTFYRLKKKWTEERSLRALAGAATRPPRGSGSAKNLQEARRVAADVVRQEGAEALSTNALALQVKQATASGISMKAAEGIVREARHELTMTGGGIPEAYGRQLLLDCCAVTLSIDRSPRRSELALLSIVMERATGLVLAATVSDRDGAAQAQFEALRTARHFLNRSDVDVPGAEAADLLVIAPPAQARKRDSLVTRLQWSLGEDAVVTSGPGRFGRRAIDRIGRRLGALHLIPRSTEHGTSKAAEVSASGREAMPLFMAQDHVLHAVGEHNRPILDAVRQARLQERARPSAAPGTMLIAIERALTDPHDPLGTRPR